MTEIRTIQHTTAAKADRDSPTPAVAGRSSVPERGRASEAQADDLGMLGYSEIPGALAEGIRGLVNRYELRMGSPLPKTIAVTSALSGEGVTTISQAAATVIAQESGAYVCWVDFSWMSATNSLPSERPDQPSLLDILADHSRLVSAVQPSTEIPRLLRLPIGQVPDSKRNMIVRSREFEELLEILSDEFDHLIFDVPAVLDNANALGLMRRSDASMLVVRHRSTTVAQVERTLDALRPTPNIGVLLNHYRPSIPAVLRRQLGG